MKFPYTLEPDQQIAADKIIEIIRTGKKHVILDAPTGSGKSVIALYVAFILGQSSDPKIIKSSNRSSPKMGIITKTINLQQQYIASRVKVDNLMGKQNYNCSKDPLWSYGDHNCFMNKDGCVDSCQYLRARSRWENSPLRLTNFSLAILADEICNLPKNRSDILVVDECHTLASELLERSLLDLSDDAFKYNLKEENLINTYKSLQKLIKSGLNNEVFKPAKYASDLYLLLPKFTEANTNQLSYAADRSLSKTERMNHLQCALECSNVSNIIKILTQAKSKSMFVEVAKNKYKAVFASDVAEYGIFRKANHFLHMTATLGGLDQFLSNLGLDRADVEVVTMPNRFKLENRPVYFMPLGKMDKIDLTEAAGIDKIIDMYDGNRGLIHTVSFARAESIKEKSRHSSRMVIPRNRLEINRLMNEDSSDMIILSPSVTTGYDFKGDLARFQIVVKIPYKYIGDRWIEMVFKYNKPFYYSEALSELIQACGRGVRDLDDYCDTFIVDERFKGVKWHQKAEIPKWFMEAIK